MSLDLADCRFKLPQAHLAYLEGKAKARGKGTCVADLLRELVEADFREFSRTLIEAERILAPKGLLGELRAPEGKFAERATDGGVDLDVQPE